MHSRRGAIGSGQGGDRDASGRCSIRNNKFKGSFFTFSDYLYNKAKTL